MSDPDALDVLVLGPLELRAGGRTLPLGGPKQRALLALLLLHANEPVSRDRLIDELWGEAAPATVNSAFHVHLSRLRRLLGDRLVREADGYRLRIEAERLDLARFERLAAAGREALALGEPGRAAELLREALSLWRGAPFSGLFEPFAVAAAARLDELRLAAVEDRIEAELALGEHHSLAAELEALAAGHPYRERLRAQLMLALYRSGRQADALDAYQQARRKLGDDLGLEPGPELRELQQAILRHESALAPPARAERAPEIGPLVPRRRRRRLPLAAGLLAVAAAAIAVPLLALGGSGPVTVPPNSVAVIDARSDGVVDSTAVGVGPSQVAVGDGSIWVINVEDGTLSRIDPATHALQRTIALPATPTGLAVGGGDVWVANGPAGSLSRVDPALERVVDTRALSVARGQSGVVTVGAGSVWAVFDDSTLRRLDPRSGRVLAQAIVGTAPAGVRVGDGAAWIANAGDNTVSRVSTTTGGVEATLTPGRHPLGIALGAGGVWVADSGDDAVARIDPTSGSVTTIPVGRWPAAIAFGDGAVWVANTADGTVSRIDPAKRRVVATIHVGGRPAGIAVYRGRVWVSVQAST